MNIKVAEAESHVDDKTKGWRNKAIQELEKLAQCRGWNKTQTARWLRETMGLNWDEAKPALFSAKQCEILLGYIDLERHHSSENEMMLAMRRAKQKNKFF